MNFEYFIDPAWYPAGRVGGRLKETLLAGYDIKFSQTTTVLSEMTSEGRQRLFYYKAFIHSFDYILFSQCSFCSCLFFFAMFMAGEGERSSICSKNEIITMNKYCFHKRLLY